MKKEREYSALFIVDPEREDALEEIRSNLNATITDNSGDVVKENLMGKKTLAYPIKKRKEGVYLEMIFKALPEAVSELNRQFRINTDLLRSLIDRKD